MARGLVSDAAAKLPDQYLARTFVIVGTAPLILSPCGCASPAGCGHRHPRYAERGCYPARHPAEHSEQAQAVSAELYHDDPSNTLRAFRRRMDRGSPKRRNGVSQLTTSARCPSAERRPSKTAKHEPGVVGARLTSLLNARKPGRWPCRRRSVAMAKAFTSTERRHQRRARVGPYCTDR